MKRLLDQWPMNVWFTKEFKDPRCSNQIRTRSLPPQKYPTTIQLAIINGFPFPRKGVCSLNRGLHFQGMLYLYSLKEFRRLGGNSRNQFVVNQFDFGE
jgi:hypothetical protein